MPEYSTSVSKQTQTDILKASADCYPADASGSPSSGSQNNSTISGSWIIGCDLTVNQVSNFDSECFITNLIEANITAAQQLDTELNGGFGLSASFSRTDIETYVTEEINSSCATGQSATNNQAITNSKLFNCNLLITQNATASQSCQINAAESLLADTNQAIEDTITGSSVADLVFGDTFSTIVIAIIVIIIILVVASVAIAILKVVASKKAAPVAKSAPVAVKPTSTLTTPIPYSGTTTPVSGTPVLSIQSAPKSTDTIAAVVSQIGGGEGASGLEFGLIVLAAILGVLILALVNQQQRLQLKRTLQIAVYQKNHPILSKLLFRMRDPIDSEA